MWDWILWMKRESYSVLHIWKQCSVGGLPDSPCPVPLSFSLIFLFVRRSSQTGPALSYLRGCTFSVLRYIGATFSTAEKDKKYMVIFRLTPVKIHGASLPSPACANGKCKYKQCVLTMLLFSYSFFCKNVVAEINQIYKNIPKLTDR